METRKRVEIYNSSNVCLHSCFQKREKLKLLPESTSQEYMNVFHVHVRQPSDWADLTNARRITAKDHFQGTSCLLERCKQHLIYATKWVGQWNFTTNVTSRRWTQLQELISSTSLVVRPRLTELASQLCNWGLLLLCKSSWLSITSGFMHG